jgi:hypothetical protein
LDLACRPNRKDKILQQRGSDSVVLLSLGNGEYYSLNEVGGRVWELCDGSHQVSDVISRICQEYEAPAELITADVVDLLADLALAELVAGVS